MRVTNQMMNGAMMQNLNRLRSRNAGLTEQISSGNRITKVSEDLPAGSDVMRTQSRLQVMGQWEKNLNDTRHWVRTTEESLSDMTELLSKAKERAMIGANGTVNQSVRNTLASEVEALLSDVLAILNGKQGEDALFGGFQTGGAPFAIDMTNGAVTYSGDAGDMVRDLGPGVTMTANLHGGRVANWAASDNPLTVLWQVADDLRNGTSDDVRSNLDNLDKAVQSAITLRAEIGTRDRRLEQLETQMKSTYIRLNEVLEQAQGVEMEKAMLELNSTETTYRAALQVGARIIPPTLVDFLR